MLREVGDRLQDGPGRTTLWYVPHVRERASMELLDSLEASTQEGRRVQTVAGQCIAVTASSSGAASACSSNRDLAGLFGRGKRRPSVVSRPSGIASP